MEDFKRLDKMLLFKVTNAVQKAASVALTSQQDRSLILADQLNKDMVPRNLTKLATDAFNRLLSVRTLGKRDDDTKALVFGLADFNKVASIRKCLQVSLDKTASVVSSEKAPFTFTVTKPAMIKAASVPVKLLKPVSVDHFMRKLLKLVETLTIEVQNKHYLLLQLLLQLRNMVKSASLMLNKDIKTSKLLATVYGDTYTLLFKDKLPLQALKKSAAYAVLPKTNTVLFVLNTIKQADLVNMKRLMFWMKKTATEQLAKEAIAIDKKVAEARLKGMIKDAGGGYSVLKDIFANAATAPLLATKDMIAGAVNQMDASTRAMSKYLNQQHLISPSLVLSNTLLADDREEDKKQRLIDMLSSYDFKDYPALLILKAVLDSLLDNKSLLSSGRRGYLKTDVASRLLANNRTNKADQAALASIMKDISLADKNTAANSAAAKTKALSSSKYGGSLLIDILPDIKGTMDLALKQTFKLRDTSGSFAKLLLLIANNRKSLEDLLLRKKEQRLKDTKGYMKAREQAMQKVLLAIFNKSQNKPAIKTTWNKVKGDYTKLSPQLRLQLTPRLHNILDSSGTADEQINLAEGEDKNWRFTPTSKNKKTKKNKKNKKNTP